MRPRRSCSRSWRRALRAFWLTVPISIVIVDVLGIIVISYRQTIRAYPNGGGSYIVAKDNLGEMAGLVAAAALLVDYVLTVSVSVAAGVSAITSAFPGLLGDNRVLLAVVGIALVGWSTCAAIRESGRSSPCRPTSSWSRCLP